MTEEQLAQLSDTLWQAQIGVFALALLTFVAGCLLFLPKAEAALRALPRARVLGIVLSTLCWVWVGFELISHPVDLLAFMTPPVTLVVVALCAVLSVFLLSNLLCARAIGGLMMLWPMPLILVIRDQVTAWRLVPVIVGYVSLTLGMIVVFYPWRFRVAMEWFASSEAPYRRWALGSVMLLVAFCSAIALLHLGKVVGE